MDTDSVKQEQKEAAFIYNERSEKIGKKASKNISAYFRESIAKSSSELQTYRLQCLKLLPKDIEYDDCGTFFPNIKLKMTRNTKNYQFIDVQVKWGFFRFKKITILTINKVSPLHDHQFYSGGNFSTVYSFRYQGSPLVCKCFERPQTFDEDSQLNILKNVIEEYCILKLASHLKVGPKVDQTMGYDIIIYFDCIEFSMQMCDQYSPKQHSKQAVKSDLLQNLAKLHSLHIIHHDIKYDNICYSRQFNKFVFIDFGFGRIVQEQVGFLTLTNYKGSLNHCSSEMVQLFHSHQEKEIDLYYNDMNALNVALSEFQNRSKGIDIAQEVQKDIDKLQESQYIYHHFFMYQLKYSLYHLEFDLLYQQDTLEEETIEELLNFVPSIYYSHKLKDACDWLLSKIQNRQFDKMQNNIFRLNYSNNNKIEEQYEEEQIENETYMMLRSINNKFCIDYVLFKYEKQVDYLLKIYQDIEFLMNVPFDQYCHFLAKAIEINSNNAKLQQLNRICEIAINNRSFFLEFDQMNTIPEGQGNYLMQVSFILFKKSIQKKLNGNYYDIFLWVVNNVIILKLISYEQILEYYQSLLKVHLKFQEKVRVFLKFNTALAWIPMMASSWPQYAIFSDKINFLIAKHTPTLIQDLTQQQSSILQFVLQRQQTSTQRQKFRSTQSSFSQKSLFYQIKMWQFYKKIVDYQYSEQNQEMLQSYECEVQFFNYSVCQYHHSMILVYYLMKKEFATLSKCIQRLESVLIFSENYKNSFISFIKSMFKLRQGNYKDIQLFLTELQPLKANGHPAISTFVKRQFEYIRYKNLDKFKKCLPNTRNAIFHVELQAIYNVYRYKNRPDFETRFLSAINKVVKESLLRQEYFQHFGIAMKNNNFLENDYHQLVKQLSSLREKQSPQRINYNTFLVLFLLVALLVNKSKYHQALFLSIHLLVVFPSIKSQTLATKDILQFIFRYVLEPMSKKYPSIKAEYRHLFFQYHDIITHQHSEQDYFDNKPIFIDVFQLLYQFRQQEIMGLINNLSKKLQKHDNKFNSDRYYDAIQLIFFRNKLSEVFIKVNSQIYKEVDLKNNHYNIIFLYQIFILMYRLKKVQWTRLIAFRMFYGIQQANMYLKQRLLQNLYILQIFNTLREVSERKKAKLIKHFIRVNKPSEICITKCELVKLFVSKESLKLLKLQINIHKYHSIKRKLECFVNKIENNQTNWRSRLLCSFNNFQISYKKTK